MYIDFTFYKENGGIITEETTFNSFNIKAQNELDFRTYGRIKTLKVVPDEVKYCMVELINTVQSKETSGGKMKGSNVSSYSNSGISVNFATVTQQEYDEKVEFLINSFLSNVRNDNGYSILFRGNLC